MFVLFLSAIIFKQRVVSQSVICLLANSGFMMMFWVWMPTVPHRQKLGILTGICFHMGVNIINNGNEEITPDVEE